MKIKHSKFKNTGLIYELLVKQIAADTLSRNESAALSILKKYFSPKTALGKELKLYEYILKNTNLTEHSKSVSKEDAKETLIEEYSKYDKDLRLLTYRILLEKFNSNYKDLLPEQKNILKEFITSVNSTTRLRNVVNEEVSKVRAQIAKLANKVEDKVVKIKLEEIVKTIVPLKKTDKITDSHLINLMQYYDLVNELRVL